MAEQNVNPAEIFLLTVIDKIDRQKGRLEQVENSLGKAEALAGDIVSLKADIRSLALNSGQIRFPENLLRELNVQLIDVSSQLRHPMKTEIHHQHHFRAMLWVVAGLFLILRLVSTGCLITRQKVQQYQAGDFKYRHLKLYTDSTLCRFFHRLDSLYEVNPDSFQNAVNDREQLKHERLELLDQIHSVDRQIGDQEKAAEREKIELALE